SAAIGVLLIGILAWPLAAPPEPFGVVSLTAGSISLGGAVVLAALAFLAGFIAYFVSWPYGREIGILAAPAGLTIWAIRSGSMVNLIRRTPATNQPELFAALRWEPFFWLAIVAVGFAGVLLAQKVKSKPEPEKADKKTNSKTNIYVSVVIALVASVLLAQLCISAFAQNVRLFDEKIGSVVAQPTAGQIIFAVFVSFGIAAFVVKTFLNASYIWPIIASSFVTAFTIISYGKQDVLQHLSLRCPAIFFSHAAISILPLQMVALGTFGSIAGYWMAIRYKYWRKHG
ncbi:MAG: hypothetical protein ACYSYL_18470, partial [Planctomycetota bacterium]